MSALRAWVWLAPAMLVLCGCHAWRSANSCHKPQDYEKAKTVAPLQIPPGLDPPDTTNALRLPMLNEPPPPPRKGKDPCLDEPPPFKVNKPTVPQA